MDIQHGVLSIPQRDNGPGHLQIEWTSHSVTCFEYIVWKMHAKCCAHPDQAAEVKMVSGFKDIIILLERDVVQVGSLLGAARSLVCPRISIGPGNLMNPSPPCAENPPSPSISAFHGHPLLWLLETQTLA